MIRTSLQVTSRIAFIKLQLYWTSASFDSLRVGFENFLLVVKFDSLVVYHMELGLDNMFLVDKIGSLCAVLYDFSGLMMMFRLRDLAATFQPTIFESTVFDSVCVKPVTDVRSKCFGYSATTFSFIATTKQ